LKLKYSETLSNFALNVKLRHYMMAVCEHKLLRALEVFGGDEDTAGSCRLTPD
jgi:hypothetical protein